MHKEDIKYMTELSKDILDDKIPLKEAKIKLKKVHDMSLAELAEIIIRLCKEDLERRNK